MTKDFESNSMDKKAFLESLDPMAKFRSELDYVGYIKKQLGITSPMLDFLQDEEKRRTMFSGVSGVTEVERITQDYKRQLERANRPVYESDLYSIFDPKSEAHNSLTTALTARKDYENSFRAPYELEVARLARETMRHDELVRMAMGTDQNLQTALEIIQSPWLNSYDPDKSARAASEIIAMGRGIDFLAPFDAGFTEAVRKSLGDWRNVVLPSEDEIIDPVRRGQYYLDRGFNPSLSSLTPAAFDETLNVAGLRSHNSTDEGDLELREEDDDYENEGFIRARDAFVVLQRFEIAIRNFIEKVMCEEYGDDWKKHQIPSEMLKGWTEKRERAEKTGASPTRLIDYADFSDYKQIIERKDNWLIVFKGYFARSQDIQESFNRLGPVRITTMHSRTISESDQLLLLFETKRILNAIRSK